MRIYAILYSSIKLLVVSRFGIFDKKKYFFPLFSIKKFYLCKLDKPISRHQYGKLHRKNEFGLIFFVVNGKRFIFAV